MKRILAILLAVLLSIVPALAAAEDAHYGWLFVIGDLGMAITISDEYTISSQESLAAMNQFEKSGNVKTDSILDVYSASVKDQMFISVMQNSPYDNIEQLMEAYLQDLGLESSEQSEGTISEWAAYADQEFMGIPCARIISKFDNVNAEYMLFLCEDHCAYIFTLITFDGQPVDSELGGIKFTLVPELSQMVDHLTTATAQPTAD